MSIKEQFRLGSIPVYSRRLKDGDKHEWAGHVLNVISPDSVKLSTKNGDLEFTREDVNCYKITGHYRGILNARYRWKSDRGLVSTRIKKLIHSYLKEVFTRTRHAE